MFALLVVTLASATAFGQTTSRSAARSPLEERDSAYEELKSELHRNRATLIAAVEARLAAVKAAVTPKTLETTAAAVRLIESDLARLRADASALPETRDKGITAAAMAHEVAVHAARTKCRKQVKQIAARAAANPDQAIKAQSVVILTSLEDDCPFRPTHAAISTSAKSVAAVLEGGTRLQNDASAELRRIAVEADEFRAPAAALSARIQKIILTIQDSDAYRGDRRPNHERAVKAVDGLKKALTEPGR